MKGFSTRLASRGSLCIGISLGLLLAGFAFQDGAFLTLSMSAMVLMVCCYVLGRLNLSRLEISMNLAERVHANRYYQPSVSVTNRRRLLDAFHVRLYIAFPHGTLVESEARWIAAHSSVASSIRFKVPMRASGLVHPYKLCSFFPLGLFHFTLRDTLAQPLVVYPRPIVPAEILRDGALGLSERPAQNSALDHSGEPRGIRAWQPGDPAKAIHWPASIRSMARGHGIRVREFDPPGQLPEACSIVFHSFSSNREMMRDDRFERAISLFVGTVDFLRNHGIETTILADFMGWHPYTLNSRADYYEFLAILADSQRAIGTEKHELMLALDAIPEKQSTIIISDMPLSSWGRDLKLNPWQMVIDIKQIKFPFKPTVSAQDTLAKTA